MNSKQRRRMRRKYPGPAVEPLKPGEYRAMNCIVRNADGNIVAVLGRGIITLNNQGRPVRL